MKITKIFFVLIGLLLIAVLFFNGCEKENGNSRHGRKSEEAIKLEKLKEQKQLTADSLKKEIQVLKEKKDSLKKAIEDEQN